MVTELKTQTVAWREELGRETDCEEMSRKKWEMLMLRWMRHKVESTEKFREEKNCALNFDRVPFV